jgi:hypothetical protein
VFSLAPSRLLLLLLLMRASRGVLVAGRLGRRRRR